MARIRTGLLRRSLLPALLAPAIMAGQHQPAAAAPEPPAAAPADDYSEITRLHVTAPPPPLGAGAAHVFTVRGIAESGAEVDVTGRVTLTIDQRMGSCVELTCTVDEIGPHTAWAGLGDDPGVVGSAGFDVVGVDRVELRPADSAVSAGESQRYIARGLHFSGEPGEATTVDVGDVTARTELSISDPGTCDDKEHACGSRRAGRYVVHGRMRGADAADGEAVLTVDPPALDRIDLWPPDATVIAGATQTYRADGFDRSDGPLGNVTHRTVLDIDQEGRCDRDGCTAERAGKYTVTGTGVGVRRPGTARLTVIAGPPAELVVEPDQARIVAGADQAYTVVARDAHHNPAGEVTDRAVLTITPPGSCDLDSCTATGPGSYRVEATVSRRGQPSLVGRAGLTVVAERVARLQLKADSDRVIAGGRRTYTALGFDRFGNPLGDVTALTTFSIGRFGRCTGASCGADRTGSYPVTGRHAGTGATGRATLHVRAGRLAQLVLDPRGATVAAGVAMSFAARGLDAFGNDAGDLTAVSAFEIDRGGSCVRESCSADEVGDHTVTATRIGTRVHGQAVLHVVVGSLARATLEPATATATVGASVQYRIRGFDAAGNLRGDAIRRAVLRVLPDGSCRGSSCGAAKPGRHMVVAVVAGLRARPTAILDVRRKPAASLRLRPSAATIAVGTTQPYEVEALDADGNSLGDVTPAARLDIESRGSCGRAGCTARTPGTYRVRADLPGSLASGQTLLYVQPGQPAVLQLEPAAATVTAGSIQVFRAQAYDALGNFLGDVTRQTRFSVEPDGSCDGPTCTAATGGPHRVTGRTVVGSARGVAALTVVTEPPPQPSPPPTAPTESSPPPGPAPPSDVVVGIVPQPGTGQVAAGAWFAFTVRALDAAGRELGDLTPEAAMLISPDGSCDGGRCRAQTAGTHQVSITARGLRAAATLEVVAAGEVARILLDPRVSYVRTGAAQVYLASGFDRYGNELGDVTDRTAFSVEGVGPCTGASCTVGPPGTYRVSGTLGGTAVGDAARLEVAAVPAAKLVLHPSTGSVRPGERKAFLVRGYDGVGNDIGDLTAASRFSIRPGGSCSAAGCTAHSPGSYTVTGTASTGVAGSVLTADAALQVLPLRPANLPVPAWLIGVVAAVVAVAAGTVLAWAFPGGNGGPPRPAERDRRPDRDGRRGRIPDLTVRPSAGSPRTRLQERRRLRPDLSIRVEPHADPDGIQTMREGPE